MRPAGKLKDQAQAMLHRRVPAEVVNGPSHRGQSYREHCATLAAFLAGKRPAGQAVEALRALDHCHLTAEARP